jgi:hypothetical protein
MTIIHAMDYQHHFRQNEDKALDWASKAEQLARRKKVSDAQG